MTTGRLTLGALHRRMRAGLGDAGLFRAVIEFEQREASTPAGEEAAAASPRRRLTAELDHRDRVLQRGVIRLADPTGASSGMELHLQRGAGGTYLYSVGGSDRWGRFLQPPRIFDLDDFEARIDEVAVNDVTIDQAIEKRRLHQAIDVDVDREAFEALLRVFSADRDEPEDLHLAAFSVSLSGDTEVELLYWWTLAGVEPAEEGGTPVGQKISCSTVIRLEPLQRIERGGVTVDGDLPDVTHIDEVWALARRMRDLS